MRGVHCQCEECSVNAGVQCPCQDCSVNVRSAMAMLNLAAIVSAAIRYQVRQIAALQI